METLRLPACVYLFPYGFGCRFPVCLLWFVFAEALPMRAEVALQAWDDGSAGVPLAGIIRAGRVRDLSGFLAVHPMPLPCSKTPAEPTGPRLVAVLPMLPPGTTHQRPQRVTSISRLNAGLQHPLPTLHERRCRRPCKARFRLAGCAFAGRGLNPLDRSERFQVTFIPLSRTSPDASRV
jgi:hypothetical protein